MKASKNVVHHSLSLVDPRVNSLGYGRSLASITLALDLHSHYGLTQLLSQTWLQRLARSKFRPFRPPVISDILMRHPNPCGDLRSLRNAFEHKNPLKRRFRRKLLAGSLSFLLYSIALTALVRFYAVPEPFEHRSLLQSFSVVGFDCSFSRPCP
jgi:hypothetical protein